MALEPVKTAPPAQFRISIAETTLAITLLVFACLKCCGTLPISLDGSHFAYIGAGIGFLGTAYGVYAFKKYNEKLFLITSLALLAFATSSYFGAVSPSILGEASLGLAAIIVTKAYLNFKVRLEWENWTKYQLKGKMGPSPKEKKIAIALGVLGLVSLVVGAMKLCGTLPHALDGSVLSSFSIVFGGAATIFNLYRLLDKEKKRGDHSHDFIAGVTCLAIGLLALTHQIDAFQNAQALVGIESGLLAFSVINFFYKNDPEVIDKKEAGK